MHVQSANAPVTATSTRLPGADIIAVTAPGRTEEIARALQDVAALVRPARDAQEAIQMAGVGTLAVVVCDGPDLGALDQTRTLLQAPATARLPLFVVVDDGCPEAHARALYCAGATAVLGWPGEVSIMPKLLIGMVDVAARDHAGQPADGTMAETIAARIDTDPSLAGALACNVHAGVATLRGTVDSAWKRRRAVSLVEHVPGVQSVDARGLGVEAAVVADEQLEQDVLGVLQSAAGIDRETIAVGASDGRVQVAGTVPDHDTLERVEQLIENIRGVEAVDNLLTVSARDTAVSKRVAWRLEETIRRASPGLDVGVTVFSGVVVISGSVRTLAEKRRLEGMVARRSDVERVVNKIVVA